MDASTVQSINNKLSTGKLSSEQNTTSNIESKVCVLSTLRFMADKPPLREASLQAWKLIDLSR